MELHARGEDPHGPRDERPLTDAEVEAVVAAEGSNPPEADQPAPQLAPTTHKPGQIAWARWIAWALVALMILGAINAYR